MMVQLAIAGVGIAIMAGILVVQHRRLVALRRRIR